MEEQEILGMQEVSSAKPKEYSFVLQNAVRKALIGDKIDETSFDFGGSSAKNIIAESLARKYFDTIRFIPEGVLCFQNLKKPFKFNSTSMRQDSPCFVKCLRYIHQAEVRRFLEDIRREFERISLSGVQNLTYTHSRVMVGIDISEETVKMCVSPQIKVCLVLWDRQTRGWVIKYFNYE